MAATIHAVWSLSLAVVGGPIDADQVWQRVARRLRRTRATDRWLVPLVQRCCAAFSSGGRPRVRDVYDLLLSDAAFRRALDSGRVRLRYGLPIGAVMWPAPGPPSTWQVPELTSIGQLSDWLGISPRELNWLADPHGLEQRWLSPWGRRYRYHVLAKGTRRFRLIEAPKRRLKLIQRQIVHAILDRVPAHEAAHGFVARSSIRSFAAPHVAAQVVLKMDMRDFFPSISFFRVTALFRTLGYPDDVAGLLAALATNCVPNDVWLGDSRELGNRPAPQLARAYSQRHLPQGAPTSPAIANLCAYRLDRRLSGLARSAAAAYTRYADDLAFSGGADFARRVKRFRHHVAAIAMDEGFTINYRKTRIMRPSARQELAGIVINQRFSPRRADYDQLKAVLTNCARHGPGLQNREGHADFRAHLLGRISFVASLHPARGEKLRSIFAQIHWA